MPPTSRVLDCQTAETRPSDSVTDPTATPPAAQTSSATSSTLDVTRLVLTAGHRTARNAATAHAISAAAAALHFTAFVTDNMERKPSRVYHISHRASGLAYYRYLDHQRKHRAPAPSSIDRSGL